VIADEPTASLDRINAETTFRLFLELVADAGATAIIATHDPERGTGPGIALVDHSLERLGDEAHAVFRRGRAA
jgi:energy-coupling factor transporter ATP-binding protein EcfA2